MLLRSLSYVQEYAPSLSHRTPSLETNFQRNTTLDKDTLAEYLSWLAMDLKIEAETEEAYLDAL